MRQKAATGWRRVKVFAGALATGLLTFGFIESCDDRLIQATRYFDPCGTVFANCTPGSFETNAAEIGDYCVDPTCPIPGACGDGQTLGTQYDLCP